MRGAKISMANLDWYSTYVRRTSSAIGPLRNGVAQGRAPGQSRRVKGTLCGLRQRIKRNVAH